MAEGDDSGVTDITLDDLDIDLEKKVYGYITAYLLTLISGVVFGIVDLINFVFDEITEIFTIAGDTIADAAATTAGSITSITDSVTVIVADVAASMGPLGPIVIVVAAGLMIAFTIRVLRAVADSIPVVSGVQTFLEGK